MTLTRIVTGEGFQEDPRLLPPKWRTPKEWRVVRKKLRLLIPVNVVLALWYFEWLLRPARIGNPVLFGLLATAEIFNLVQAAGFWWTTWHAHDRRPAPPWPGPLPEVDVLIPVYNEPLDVVAPTLAAAAQMRCGRVTVHLLDDAGRPELAGLARETGAEYIRRGRNTGAKAGNLNHALARITAPFVAIFDCDHVPDSRFLEATLGWLRNENVAFVQTPQYYANASSGQLAAAAASQQSLFFGGIARGKDGLGSMFCCGTNVVFRRSALDDVGGFPEDSLTEDFQLSVLLHERGWRSVYVNEVLAQGLGPEDMASYVSQQARWARGCLSALPAVMRAGLSWRTRLQYMFSSMFFLSGWTFALYMALPVIRIFFGLQPLASATSDQFRPALRPVFLPEPGGSGRGRSGHLHLRRVRPAVRHFLRTSALHSVRVGRPAGPVRGHGQAGRRPRSARSGASHTARHVPPARRHRIRAHELHGGKPQQRGIRIAPPIRAGCGFVDGPGRAAPCDSWIATAPRSAAARAAGRLSLL